MNEAEHSAMMKSMMDQFCSGVSADDTKEMCASMMAMMSGAACESPAKMQEMMANMIRGGPGQQMPEMMLTMMMPRCIGTLLPAVPADRRGEVAGRLLSAIVETGSAGLSREQTQGFLTSIGNALKHSA